MRAWWLVAIAGCTPPPPAPPAPIVNTDGVAPDAVDHRWIFRELSVGRLHAGAWVSTYTLTFDGDRVTFDEETARAVEHGAPVIHGWRLDRAYTSIGTARRASSYSFTGDAADAAGREPVILDLQAPGGPDPVPWIWRCDPERIEVAPAAAMLVPADGAACDEPPVWSMSARVAIDVLRCGSIDLDGVTIDGTYVFSRAPGIEHLYIQDECKPTGDGLRRIPFDGSIARVRR
jgi:hypothetical protein